MTSEEKLFKGLGITGIVALIVGIILFWCSPIEIGLPVALVCYIVAMIIIIKMQDLRIKNLYRMLDRAMKMLDEMSQSATNN